MKKTIVYYIDAINPNILDENLRRDSEDKTIKEIIIPTFVLKAGYKKFKNFSSVINKIQSSLKVTVKDFPVLYSEENSIFAYFVLFITKISKEYRNIYIKTRKVDIIIEFLKRGFKIFQEKEYDDIFENITPENSLIAKSNAVFFDTCYYVEMFTSNVGLNILKDKGVKKIIYSSILEELIKISKTEIFNFLVFLISNKKDYNIEFIVSSPAYATLYNCDDLMMLSYIMQSKSTKNQDEITVYTYDLEFLMQCISLNIKTENYKISQDPLIYEKSTDDKKEDIEISERKDILNSQIEIPLLIKKDIAYISFEYTPIIFKDIASGMYSNILKKNSTKYYQIKQGYHAKLKNEKNIFRIAKIDIKYAVAYLEKINLVL